MKPNLVWKKKVSGSTLIEVLVASVILFVSLTGTLLLFSAASRNQREGAMAMEGSTFAAQYINEYRALGYDALCAAAGCTGTSPDGGAGMPPPTTETVLLDADVPDPNGRMLHVHVTINGAASADGGITGDCLVLYASVTWENHSTHITEEQTSSGFVSHN